jgi:hypothetical protein
MKETTSEMYLRKIKDVVAEYQRLLAKPFPDSNDMKRLSELHKCLTLTEFFVNEAIKEFFLNEVKK